MHFTEKIKISQYMARRFYCLADSDKDQKDLAQTAFLAIQEAQPATKQKALDIARHAVRSALGLHRSDDLERSARGSIETWWKAERPLEASVLFQQVLTHLDKQLRPWERARLALFLQDKMSLSPDLKAKIRRIGKQMEREAL